MAKKNGRPPKAVRQEKFLGFYATNAEHLIIQQKVFQFRGTFSDYMRKMALYGKVITRWTPEEREQIRKLVDMSNDLNKMVEIAKREGMLTAILHFEKYRNVIDDTIKSIHHAQQNFPNGKDVPGDM
jgi:hypothetical protein